MTQKRSTPSGNRAVLILAAIAVCIPLLGLGLRQMARQVVGPGPQPARTLGQVSLRTGVQFPVGSRLIDGVVNRSWHSYAYARIAVPPEQVPDFWRQPLFESPPVPARPSMSFYNMIGPRLVNEWQLWKVKDFRYNGGGQFDHGGAVEALLSLDDPARPILYLYWWTG